MAIVLSHAAQEMNNRQEGVQDERLSCHPPNPKLFSRGAVKETSLACRLLGLAGSSLPGPSHAHDHSTLHLSLSYVTSQS